MMLAQRAVEFTTHDAIGIGEQHLVGVAKHRVLGRAERTIEVIADRSDLLPGDARIDTGNGSIATQS